MATSQIEVESRVTELATQAFKVFCEDISGTFGVDTKCRQKAIAAETVAGLQKRFKKLVTVNIVDSEGFPDRTFHFIFDQEGIFTLGGIIAMLPAERIMSNRQNASAKLAEDMVEAMGEAEYLLVGSWDKVFSERLEGHNRFSLRLPAFIGKPWGQSGNSEISNEGASSGAASKDLTGKSEETMGLAGNEEVFILLYEMTIGSYPAFNCGVIFPKKFFAGSFDFAPKAANMTKETTQEKNEENTQNMQTINDGADSEEYNKEPDTLEGSDGEESKQEQPSVEETTAETTDAGEIEQQAQAEQVPEDTADSENAAVEQNNAEESQLREPEVSSDQVDTAPGPNAANDVAEETVAAPETIKEPAMSKIFETIQKITQSPADLPGQPATGKIFEVIQKITQSPAVLPGHSTLAKNATTDITGHLFEICANDIMQNQVTWASPDESLQQAFAKMQQTDAGYIMIGQNGVLEGIVSKSDTTRAMSPYLQPIFAKWRRPLDDATLKIRIKWIMSRPVRTIKPETSLAAIMEHMSQFRGRCLPVTDEQGNVQGLVTAFDIFRALLKNNSNTCSEDQTVPALVESASPAGAT